MADQWGETLGADGPFADVGVTVTVPAELDLGVVEVKTAQPIHADRSSTAATRASVPATLE